MAVAVIIDIPGGNEHVYDQLTARLFPAGQLPEGWLVHLAGPTPQLAFFPVYRLIRS